MSAESRGVVRFMSKSAKSSILLWSATGTRLVCKPLTFYHIASGSRFIWYIQGLHDILQR